MLLLQSECKVQRTQACRRSVRGPWGKLYAWGWWRTGRSCAMWLAASLHPGKQRMFYLVVVGYTGIRIPVRDSARCLQVKDQLMAVGRARQNGIEVPGLGIMSGGRFEEHAGSKLHRPNQHTLAPSGKSLQVPALHAHTVVSLVHLYLSHPACCYLKRCTKHASHTHSSALPACRTS